MYNVTQVWEDLHKASDLSFFNTMKNISLRKKYCNLCLSRATLQPL